MSSCTNGSCVNRSYTPGKSQGTNTLNGNWTGPLLVMMAGKANTISRGGKINKTSKKPPCWICRSAGRFCLSFWDHSLGSTGQTRIVSIQYQEPFGRAKKPVFMRVWAVSSVIPTRSCQKFSKQICLRDLAQGIGIISIIQIVEAIWFFVAIVLPAKEQENLSH